MALGDRGVATWFSSRSPTAGVVGVVSAAVVPLLAEADTLVRITALSVTAALRSHGVGRALVAAVEQRAWQMAAAVVEVGSGRRPERAAAHRLHPALGYRDADATAARYWKWIEPCEHARPAGEDVNR